MDAVESFLAAPTAELLNSLSKDNVFKVAEHFQIEITLSKTSKVHALRTFLKDRLVERQVLTLSSDTEEPAAHSSPHLVAPVKLSFDTSRSNEGLTFEQRKELRLLELEQQSKDRDLDRQLELDKFKVQRELELQKEEYGLKDREQARQLELEKIRFMHQLEEKKLAHEVERLRLVAEGKITDGTLSGNDGRSAGLNLAHMIKLLPRFNEKDPDVFFSLFESIAEDRGWDDTDKILLLQSVLVGKAQEAYISLSGSQRKVYKSVKEAVLKVYELVAEAYRQRFRSWRKGEKQAHVEVARELGTHFYRWLAAEV
ncbi:uncharacterized protein LOC121719922 [Alosa sapidissima]|uniref:uncharacterized protein LOC121719922 n=1 Tax=Alosa sapidissima TaxID=34773 RepID=UPI001C08E12D|nr:uncharacterized protein LOC121719922 [Alosa sapidissima]